MKVGISTATFFTKVLTEDSFSVIKRLGADTCEVFLTTFYEYKDAFAQLLKERKGDFDAVRTATVQQSTQNVQRRGRNIPLGAVGGKNSRRKSVHFPRAGEIETKRVYRPEVRGRAYDKTRRNRKRVRHKTLS